MASPVKITVCGSNPGSQLVAGLAASRCNMEVTVFATEDKAAEKWTAALKAKDATMLVNFPRKDGSMFAEKGRPVAITNSGGAYITDSDVIIMSSSASLFADYFKVMKRFVKKRTVIIGLPGRSGFEYQCRSSLGEIGEQCTIVNLETFPWQCDLITFGLQVDIKSTVKSILGSTAFGIVPPKRGPLSSIQLIIGGESTIRSSTNFMSVLLSPFNYLKSCLVFGRWSEWDEISLEVEPGLFEGVTEKTAEMFSGCASECSQIIQAIKTSRPDVKLSDYQEIVEWMSEYKDCIGDSTSLLSMLQTNRIWGDIKHPMKKKERKKKTEYIPDLEGHISEYLPYGLLVIRGVAEIASVKTPMLDKLITWCQSKIKKTYLKNGKLLTDKNIQNTACPQKFKFQSLSEVLLIREMPADPLVEV